ncbi:nuclear protein Qri2/Nse4 [Histoplasma capsulatum var. duboisii H88]|nr:nuclear protein Qri2/Nse4 [Histoplasma capsulatum var. duboisii H88]
MSSEGGSPASPAVGSSDGTAFSPSPSFSSDKENRTSARRLDKRKPGHLTSESTQHSQAMADASNKRRRVSEKGGPDRQSQATPRRQPRHIQDTDLYDPDQDPEERRKIRKGFRDLVTNLNDSRAEYLQPGSDGIRTTLDKANELYKSVKQTSDATIDSRLLVSAADLSYRRTAKAVLGDGETGIDVDEFVSKCISFMRQGPRGEGYSLSSTQRRRRRITGNDPNEEDSDEEGDPLNWDWLGRKACVPNNLRPSLSGFLLGPLSVQKRFRQQSQRRARQARLDPSQNVQPQDVKETDTDKQEVSNLTTMCTDIREILVKTQTHSETLVNEELCRMGSDVSEDVIKEVMSKHAISDDGGVPLFRFCINPKSFGQTVENLFYISFLVRDGSVGISLDSNQLPTLLPSQPAAPSEAQAKKMRKHQTVFSLDFETWENLIKVFDIREPLIPHRNDEATERANKEVATTLLPGTAKSV